ncbi:MAG: glutaminyl-peptide cyclotransferase [Actinomycetota bacterium]
MVLPSFHRVRVLERLPHLGRGFTQGLIADGRAVWESTGLYGQSLLRRYQLGASRDDDCGLVPPEFWAEGICRRGDQIWQLTWQEGVALRWSTDPLTLLETVPYDRDGWGICDAGEFAVTSDGGSELVLRNLRTLAALSVVEVRCAGRQIGGLNDLDWADGLVWANVIGRPYLAGIDLASGDVVAVVDARSVAEQHADPEAVMNGVAALPGPGEFLLTGKTWRSIYHVRLAASRPRKDPARLLLGS